jgi:hypothetical protein
LSVAGNQPFVFRVQVSMVKVVADIARRNGHFDSGVRQFHVSAPVLILLDDSEGGRLPRDCAPGLLSFGNFSDQRARLLKPRHHVGFGLVAGVLRAQVAGFLLSGGFVGAENVAVGAYLELGHVALRWLLRVVRSGVVDATNNADAVPA